MLGWDGLLATVELVTCWARAAFVPGTGGGGKFSIVTVLDFAVLAVTVLNVAVLGVTVLDVAVLRVTVLDIPLQSCA